MNQSVRSLLRGAVLAPVAIAVTVAAAPGGYAVQGPGDEPGRLNFNPSDPSSLFSGEQGADWSTATVRGMLSAARNGAASLQGGVNFRKNRAAAKRRDANGLRPNVQKQSLTVNCQTYNGSARPADAELNGARRRDACVAKGGVGASEDAEPLMPANGRLARSVGKSLWTTADAEPAAGTPGSRQGSRVRTDDRTPTPMAAPPSAGGTLGGGLIGSLLS
ncbi:MAG: hypothetical protein IRY90_10200, partial [Actinomadura rubrobrunea]|nr:hypothetical protein [Actinomadura rubrobrunea]